VTWVGSGSGGGLRERTEESNDVCSLNYYVKIIICSISHLKENNINYAYNRFILSLLSLSLS